MRHYFLQGSFGVFNKCALMSLGLMIYILYIRLSAWCVSQCFYRQSLNLKREKNIFKGVILCKIDLLHLIAGASEQPLSSFLSCSHWGSFEPHMHLPHFNLFFFSFLFDVFRQQAGCRGSGCGGAAGRRGLDSSGCSVRRQQETYAQVWFLVNFLNVSKTVESRVSKRPWGNAVTQRAPAKDNHATSCTTGDLRADISRPACIALHAMTHSLLISSYRRGDVRFCSFQLSLV